MKSSQPGETLGKSVLGREDSWCKGPEVGMSSVKVGEGGSTSSNLIRGLIGVLKSLKVVK